jgi:hypothetical protein
MSARRIDFAFQGEQLRASLANQPVPTPSPNPSPTPGPSTTPGPSPTPSPSPNPSPISPTVTISTPGGTTVTYSRTDPNGKANAQAIARTFDGDNQRLATWFGQPKINGVSIGLDPSLGDGAVHDFGTTFISAGDVRYDGARSPIGPGNVVAEQVENYEYAQNKGWDAGKTNGEALSQFGAFTLHPESNDNYVQYDQKAWLDKYGAAWAKGDHSKGNFITNNSAADTNFAANGQGLMFLQWMTTQKTKNGKPIDFGAIAQAGGSNLGETYQRLTGRSASQGLTGFSQAVAQIPRDANGNFVAPGWSWPNNPDQQLNRAAGPPQKMNKGLG